MSINADTKPDTKYCYIFNDRIGCDAKKRLKD